MCKANITLLDELKFLYGIKTNVDLAERIKVPVKTIEKWIFKNEIPARGQSIQYIELLIANATKLKELEEKFNEMKSIVSQ